jgi:large subunit ribosomal protein L29
MDQKKETDKRTIMELDKIRSLSDEDIKIQERQAADQLFRLRFQSKLGQNEGVKKQRSLKLDLARFKTIARERQLGIVHTAKAVTKAAPKAKKSAEPVEAPAEKKAAAAKSAKTAKAKAVPAAKSAKAKKGTV